MTASSDTKSAAPGRASDRLAGVLLLATTALVIVAEWGGGQAVSGAAGAAALASLLVLAPGVRWTRQIFVAVGLALVAAAMALRDDWTEMLGAAAASSAFIAAFFSAMATLRNAASSSKAIETCGRFLAQQPPGRRYAALTVGGHLFGLLLNYGSLVLLGSLAEANARREQNAEIRAHRVRRMLVAVQRGFVSTLTWSPLAFAIAITTSLVPGAEWAEAVGACLVSSAILAGTGWALDTVFKPRLSVPRPPREPVEGGWIRIWPLVALIGIIVVLVGGLHVATDVRVVGVVMPVVPILSALWIAIQSADSGPLSTTARRAWGYVARDLPQYRSEIVLLMMAGFIGTLGSRLLAPAVSEAGLDPTALPGWAILVAMVWVIPLTGQIGMNPILTVSLVAPLLPEAAAMGVTPVDLIVAITAGWALSGASSPYTATTLLIGALGRVSALHVGWRWNGVYTLTCAVALSAWVLAVAAW